MHELCELTTLHGASTKAPIILQIIISVGWRFSCSNNMDSFLALWHLQVNNHILTISTCKHGSVEHIERLYRFFLIVNVVSCFELISCSWNRAIIPVSPCLILLETWIHWCHFCILMRLTRRLQKICSLHILNSKVIKWGKLRIFMNFILRSECFKQGKIFLNICLFNSIFKQLKLLWLVL